MDGTQESRNCYAIMDVYEAIPMPDGDPLVHLTVTIIIIALWYLIMWIYYKIEDYTN